MRSSSNSSSNRKRKLENLNSDLVKPEWFRIPSHLLVDSPLQKLKRQMINHDEAKQVIDTKIIDHYNYYFPFQYCFQKKKKSYAECRKEAASLRKNILALVKCDEKAADQSVIPSDEECNLIRYYYYINQGVDIGNISPLEKSWLDNILSRVPGRTKCRKELIRGLINEINVGDFQH